MKHELFFETELNFPKHKGREEKQSYKLTII